MIDFLHPNATLGQMQEQGRDGYVRAHVNENRHLRRLVESRVTVEHAEALAEDTDLTTAEVRAFAIQALALLLDTPPRGVIYVDDAVRHVVKDEGLTERDLYRVQSFAGMLNVATRI